jgi:hypothetical protein
MRDLLIGMLGLGAVLALGAIVTCLIVVSRKQRQRVWAQEELRRQSRRRQLLSSLESVDLAMTRLATAALRGSEQSAQERSVGLAQVVDAANRSGDDELRRLSEVVVARCDALSAAERREGEDWDRLVRQLGEAQREVYRRMEVLLDQTFD